MPELPEVETIRRQLGPRLAGRSVLDATAHASSKFASARAAVGARIGAVGRRGKYLLVDLDGVRELVIHLGMTGRLAIRPTHGQMGPHVRASWTLSGGEVLELTDVRRFGRVAVVDRGEYGTLPTLASLGPEPFDPDFTASALWRALEGSRRATKTQLLGQRVVAGVGNIYADEALWVARVHPASTVVGRAAAGRLRDAVVEVLTAGITHGGTTLRDYVDAEGGRGTNQHHLRCYGRAGLPCERCGRELRRSVIDGRSSTWCPGCQRRRHRRSDGRPATSSVEGFALRAGRPPGVAR